jgi:hypothetical protein
LQQFIFADIVKNVTTQDLKKGNVRTFFSSITLRKLTSQLLRLFGGLPVEESSQGLSLFTGSSLSTGFLLSMPYPIPLFPKLDLVRIIYRSQAIGLGNCHPST